MSLFQLLNDSNSRSFLTDFSPTLGQKFRFFTHATFPGIAWAILLASAVWLYLAFIPKRSSAITAEASSAARTREHPG
jgi:hypothetical protein